MTFKSMGRMKILAGLALISFLLIAIPAWGASKAEKAKGSAESIAGYPGATLQGPTLRKKGR